MPPFERTCLMFDRRWIANHHGERRADGECSFKACPPPKPSEPFLVADKPWESMSNGWGTMIHDQGVYRLWYEAWDNTYKDDSDGRLCYAESTDGLHWKKPVLHLVEYQGSTENNIVFDGRMAAGLGFHGHCVFIDPTSPPEARYRLVFIGVTNQHVDPTKWGFTHLTFGYSGDGLRWHWGVPEGWPWVHPPIGGFGSDTQQVVYWDPDRRLYVGYFRNWDAGYGRTIGRATTASLSRWPTPETILTADEQDPFGVDLYNNAASRYVSGTDVAHFIFTSVFNHESDTLCAQLATSRDGIRYKRLDRTPFIANGAGFDRGGIYTCPGVHAVGDELVMVYHGVDYKHDSAVPAKISYAGGYGMLRFPRDRFQGLHTSSRFEFSLEAFPTTANPVEILLNATVRSGGEIRGGLMPAHGPVTYLDGFSLGDCEPVTADGTGLRLRWKGGNKLPVSPGTPVELGLLMTESVLYSVRISS